MEEQILENVFVCVENYYSNNYNIKCSNIRDKVSEIQGRFFINAKVTVTEHMVTIHGTRLYMRLIRRQSKHVCLENDECIYTDNSDYYKKRYPMAQQVGYVEKEVSHWIFWKKKKILTRVKRLYEEGREENFVLKITAPFTFKAV